MKKITIDDVAKKSNVSKGTVSAVINGKSTVKPSTRDHILEVMRELNFRPKGGARNLKSGAQDKSIGIIIKDINYSFYTSIAAGAMEYAASKGYSLLMTSSNADHEWEKKYSHLFSAKDIKGVIIAPTVVGSTEIEHLFKLKMINYPFVLLEEVMGIQANVVAIDNIKAIKRAVKYLIDSGHRHIVHFAGPENSSHTQERIEGFKYALGIRRIHRRRIRRELHEDEGIFREPETRGLSYGNRLLQRSPGACRDDGAEGHGHSRSRRHIDRRQRRHFVREDLPRAAHDDTCAPARDRPHGCGDPHPEHRINICVPGGARRARHGIHRPGVYEGSQRISPHVRRVNPRSRIHADRRPCYFSRMAFKFPSPAERSLPSMPSISVKRSMRFMGYGIFPLNPHCYLCLPVNHNTQRINSS